jgi:hypothetical protein
MELNEKRWDEELTNSKVHCDSLVCSRFSQNPGWCVWEHQQKSVKEVWLWWPCSQLRVHVCNLRACRSAAMRLSSPRVSTPALSWLPPVRCAYILGALSESSVCIGVSPLIHPAADKRGTHSLVPDSIPSFPHALVLDSQCSPKTYQRQKAW